MFVDLLAACDVDRTWLDSEAAGGNLNRLFSELKSRVLRHVPRQVAKVERQLDSCLAATIDWMAKSTSSRREKRDRGEGGKHGSSFGPKTPPESPLSG